MATEVVGRRFDEIRHKHGRVFVSLRYDTGRIVFRCDAAGALVRLQRRAYRGVHLIWAHFIQLLFLLR